MDTLLKERSELVNYAREVLEILNSDDLLQKGRDVCEKVDLMASKLDKGKDNTAATIQSMTSSCCFYQ